MVRLFPLLLIVASACDKNVDPPGPIPEPIPAVPSTGGGGAARNPHMGMGADPHAGMGGDPHAGLNMGMDPHGGGGDPIDPTRTLEGTIEIAPALAGKVAAGDRIFLVARMLGEDGKPFGGPLAVDVTTAGTFPIAFHLDESKRMMPGTELQGNVIVLARVDRDGEASTRLAGDIEGVVRTTVPAKGLKLVLDTVVP